MEHLHFLVSRAIGSISQDVRCSLSLCAANLLVVTKSFHRSMARYLLDNFLRNMLLEQRSSPSNPENMVCAIWNMSNFAHVLHHRCQFVPAMGLSTIPRQSAIHRTFIERFAIEYVIFKCPAREFGQIEI